MDDSRDKEEAAEFVWKAVVSGRQGGSFAFMLNVKSGDRSNKHWALKCVPNVLSAHPGDSRGQEIVLG